jgi:hypothetical protein
MLSRSGLLIGASALIAWLAIPVAPASATLLGAPDGVTATQRGTRLEVRFTPAALARVPRAARNDVTAGCRKLPPPAVVGFADDSSADDAAYAHGDVGADGVARMALDAGAAMDVCDLSGRLSPGTFARVSLSSAGETWLAEGRAGHALRDLLQRARVAQGYRPVAVLGAGVAALDGPEATPPIGQIGYWTDGAHATAATVSAAGRRLVIQDLGAGMLRTNVLEQSDPFEVEVGALAGGADGSKDPEADRTPSPFEGRSVRAAQGVRGAAHGRRLTVGFTGTSARAFRAIAGRRAAAICFARPRVTLLPGTLPSALHRAWTRVPRHGGAVTFTFPRTAGDACVVVDDGRTVAVVGATATGRRWLQDVDALVGLVKIDTQRAFPRGATAYPTAAEAARLSPDLTAIAGPAAPVPLGQVGVWTDGARQAVLASASASGHRYVIADEGDGMVHTNVYAELEAVLLLSYQEVFEEA